MNPLAGLEFLYFATEKEWESKFSAAQIGIWEDGTKVCPRAAFTRLVSRLKASRFTAGLSMGALMRLKPVSNGLFFRFSLGFSHVKANDSR